jgi:3-hydroxyisobutyrate dehydrogenase-like beta-hydroxyacid dehydrogenase
MQTTEFDAGAYATAVARYGLARAEPPSVVSDQDWSLALATLADEKIVGIACAAATEGWLPLGKDQYDELVRRQRQAMAWCLGLERRLLQIAEAFDSAGVDFLVLKGPALARTVYPDPSWRMFNDLDILVRTPQWRAAVEVLNGAFDWPRRLPEPRRGFDERFGKAAVFTTDTGQQIDLHRNLAQGPFGVWIEADELFERTEPLEVGGTTLRRLDRAALFVHACVHAVLGEGTPTLLQRRDVAETGRCTPDHLWLGRVARAWRLGLVVARAVETSLTPDGPWNTDLRGTVGSAAGDWAIRAYEPDRRARGEMHIATLRAMHGLSPRIRYLRDLALPRREFARVRGAERWRKPLHWVMPGGRRGEGWISRGSGNRKRLHDDPLRAIGVIGLGTVGGTVADAFRVAGNVVIGYDPYLGVGSPAELAACSVLFVCVPTPGSDDGSLDVSAVWKATTDVEPYLAERTIVVVKSTVPPGTSDGLSEAFPRLDFASIPEFLVTRAPMETFTNPDRVVVGARSASTAGTLVALISLVAPAAPVIVVDPTEAELIKLCANAMLAAKVSLANEMALVCEAFGVVWERVQAGVGADPRIGSSHLDVFPERGFSGGCLPKDLDGLIDASRSAGHVPPLLEGVAEFNRMIRRVPLLEGAESS